AAFLFPSARRAAEPLRRAVSPGGQARCRTLRRNSVPRIRARRRVMPGTKETEMKRRVSGVALVALALALAALTGCSVHYDGDDSVTHQFGSDFFGAGGMLNLTEPVEGDAILTGGHVSTASEVSGDLVAAGGEVSVGGAIGDDLSAAGGSVQVDAIVDGNARVAGGDINARPATNVA